MLLALEHEAEIHLKELGARRLGEQRATLVENIKGAHRHEDSVVERPSISVEFVNEEFEIEFKTETVFLAWCCIGFEGVAVNR